MGDPIEGLAVPEPVTVLAPDLHGGSAQERMAELYRMLAELVASDEQPVVYAGDPSDEQPVVYAGDCVSTIGMLAGLERKGLAPTLVFFDAHGDFNTWDTTPSGFIGGMPLAMLTGRGERSIVSGTGLTPLADDRVILVDGRDLDPGEDRALADSDVRLVSVSEAPDAIPPRRDIYVHVDADVVDPIDMPAMNYPAPGGPPLGDVTAALRAIAATGRVVAFSVSTWNPALPGADVAAEATRQIVAPFLPTV